MCSIRNGDGVGNSLTHPPCSSKARPERLMTIEVIFLEILVINGIWNDQRVVLQKCDARRCFSLNALKACNGCKRNLDC